MRIILFCLLTALLTANLSADTNSVITTKAAIMQASATNNSAERELQKLMEQDDAAQAVVDQWIRDNEDFAAKGAGLTPSELNRRIRRQFEPVRAAYENFIRQHTNHVRARVAYASFLGDLRDEAGQLAQLQTARALDANDPAIWNNLANYHSRNGPVTNAFDYYAKAMELNPREPTYPQNLANVVFLFRTEAMEHYGVNEQQVVRKAQELYGRALKLDPGNFLLAADVAKTFYGIRPARPDESLRAWTNAVSLARDDLEREGVQLHFARIKIQAGRIAEARAHLNAVTNEACADLKKQLGGALASKAAEAKPPSP